jgi:hypothetical protein
MAIDDHPYDALEQRFQVEDTFVSPVTRKVLSLVSTLPLPWPLDKAVSKIKDHLGADSTERIRLMLETCINEVRKHEDEITRLGGTMSTRDPEKRAETSMELLLVGARRAESTRDKERVRRVGLILANALVEPDTIDPDEVEEMMRIATELSDHEVKHLRELIRIEGHMLEAQDHIPRSGAHTTWEQGFWGSRVNPEIDSIFSKLESYGLVARVAPPNNLNIHADFQNRYVLLKKGLRFTKLIREAAAAEA